VGWAGQAGAGQESDLGGCRLPVAVHAQREVEAVLVREAVAGLHGAADPEIERKPKDAGPARSGGPGRVVARTVVDDDNLDLRVGGADLVDDGADRPLFVVGGDDSEPAHGGKAG